MELTSLFVRLGLKSIEYDKGILKAHKSAKNFGDSLKTLKRVAVGAFVGWGMNRIINEWEQLSATQEKAEAGLIQAMKSMGRHTKEFEETLFDTAGALQEMTTFGDENIMTGMKFLLTYKQIGDDVLPRASSVMTDIAALMGGDMRSAANMLGKASMGLTGELRRVGITVERTTYESEGFIGVLREIESQVKGQAAALRATKAGGLEAFGNVVGDVQEKFGLFTSTVKFRIASYLLPALEDANKKFEELKKTGQLDEWAKDVSDNFIKTAKTLLIGSASIADSLSTPLQSIQNELNFMWEGFKKLPDWVKGIGVAGALVGGKKGTIVIGGLLHLVEAVGNSLEGFNQVLEGNIKFTELAGMNAQELREKLEELKEKGLIPAKEDLGNLNVTLGQGAKDQDFFTQQALAFIEILERYASTVNDSVIPSIKDLSDAQKETHELTKKQLEERRQILERFQDDFAKSTLTNYELELQTLNERYETYKQHIEDKAMLDQWYASELQRLNIERTLEEREVMGSLAQAWGLTHDEIRAGSVNAWKDVGNALADASKQFATLFTDVLKGSLTAKEAIKKFGEYLLTTVVETLVRIGVQQLILAALGKSIQAAQVAATVSSMSAITASATPAAMALSMATWGASAAAGMSAYISGLGAMTGASMGTISAFQALGSFDQGGISTQPGLYYAGVPEAHIPLKDGSVPVEFKDTSGIGMQPLKMYLTVQIGQESFDTYITDMIYDKTKDGEQIIHVRGITEI